MLFRFFHWLENISWIAKVNSTASEISVVWLVHYLGMFLLVGTAILLNLGVLGLAGRRQSIQRLAGQLFTWNWLGLGMVILSGIIMFAGQATIFYPATVFQIKMLVFLVALSFGLAVQWNVAKWSQLPAMPIEARLLAFISLVLWIGAILAGLEVAAFLPI